MRLWNAVRGTVVLLWFALRPALFSRPGAIFDDPVASEPHPVPFSYLNIRHGVDWVQILSLPFNTSDLDFSFRKRKRSDPSAISANGGWGGWGVMP